VPASLKKKVEVKKVESSQVKRKMAEESKFSGSRDDFCVLYAGWFGFVEVMNAKAKADLPANEGPEANAVDTVGRCVVLSQVPW
jgi:hypothetical protein